MVGMALAKSRYAISTWTRTVRLVREHAALRAAIGGEVPPEWACYRFTRKLRETDALGGCIDQVFCALATDRQGQRCFGRDVAIDAARPREFRQSS